MSDVFSFDQAIKAAIVIMVGFIAWTGRRTIGRQDSHEKSINSLTLGIALMTEQIKSMVGTFTTSESTAKEQMKAFKDDIKEKLSSYETRVAINETKITKNEIEIEKLRNWKHKEPNLDTGIMLADSLERRVSDIIAKKKDLIFQKKRPEDDPSYIHEDDKENKN